MDVLDEFKLAVKDVILDSEINDVRYHNSLSENSLLFDSDDLVKVTVVMIDPDDHVSKREIWDGCRLNDSEVRNKLKRTLSSYNAWKAALVAAVNANWSLDKVHVYKIDPSRHIDADLVRDEIDEELDKLFDD